MGEPIMFSKIPPWMKDIMKELTNPPTFIHHSGVTKQPGSSAEKAKQTGSTKSSSTNASNSKAKTKRTTENPRTFGDESSSPTDPPNNSNGNRKKSNGNSPSRSSSGAGINQAKAKGTAAIHPDYDMRVLQSYPFQIEQFEAYQNIVRLETASNNTLAFKLASIPPEKVHFIYRALQYAKKQGYEWFSPIVSTNQGKPFVKHGPQTYYVTRWIDGEHADFSALTQLGKTAESLARFHESTIGFETTGQHPHMAFDLFQRYLERSQQMLSMTRMMQAKSRPSEAEQLFIRNASSFQQQASLALSLLKDPNVVKHLDQEEDAPGICHLDIVERNVILHKAKHAYLIDFDNMTYAPRVLDLAHLIRRGMQKTNWLPEVALVSLINYNGIRPLSHTEYMTLEALLTFPHRWWRLIQMSSQGSSSSLLPMIETCLEQEKNRQQFLRSFSRQVTRHKTVS
jgi:CotS family spore coat protein